jgi:hypothetical protein
MPSGWGIEIGRASDLWNSISLSWAKSLNRSLKRDLVSWRVSAMSVLSRFVFHNRGHDETRRQGIVLLRRSVRGGWAVATPDAISSRSSTVCCDAPNAILFTVPAGDISQAKLFENRRVCGHFMLEDAAYSLAVKILFKLYQKGTLDLPCCW